MMRPPSGRRTYDDVAEHIHFEKCNSSAALKRSETKRVEQIAQRTLPTCGKSSSTAPNTRVPEHRDGPGIRDPFGQSS